MQRKYLGRSGWVALGALTALMVGSASFVHRGASPSVGLSGEPAQAQTSYTVGQTIVVKLGNQYYLATIDKVYRQSGFTMIAYRWRQNNRSGSGTTAPDYYKDQVFTVEEARRRGFTLANSLTNPATPSSPAANPAAPTPKPSSPVPVAAQPTGSDRCPGSSSSLTSAEIDEILRVHNAARAEVNVPPLTWNCKLAAFSQNWVDRNPWGHSPTSDRENIISGSYVGENLAAVAPADRPIATSGSMDWWSEKQFWQNGTKTCEPGKVCGHYTQMVWRATTEIGCGLNRKASVLGSAWQGNSAYLSCTYNPGGNYNGEAPY